MTKRFGFTLAEVLITLGIIGVVAAMTIPTLITNYNDKVLETQKQKTKSILANAFKMMMANEGVTDLSLAPIASCGTDSNCYAAEFKKVLKVVSDIDSTSNDGKIEYSFSNGNSEVWSQNKLYTFVLNDGTIVSLENTDGIANGALNLVVDLNGFKTPNIGAKDLCRYAVNNNAIVAEQCGTMTSLPETTPEGCGAGFLEHEGECYQNPSHCLEAYYHEEYSTQAGYPVIGCSVCEDGYSTMGGIGEYGCYDISNVPQ